MKVHRYSIMEVDGRFFPGGYAMVFYRNEIGERFEYMREDGSFDASDSPNKKPVICFDTLQAAKDLILSKTQKPATEIKYHDL